MTMGKEEPGKVKAKRHTPNQVIRKLREAELMLGEGRSTAEVAKALEVSEVTFHRWRAQYGGMKAEDAKRLKELEREERRVEASRGRQGARGPRPQGDREGTDESQVPRSVSVVCSALSRVRATSCW